MLQMTVSICGLQTETVEKLVCRLLVSTMYDCALKFLSIHVIVATTARQRLEKALTPMRLLERHPNDERRLSRLCAADCDLSAIIELHVDLGIFDSTSVLLHVLERLAESCRVQADAVFLETLPRPDIVSDPAEGFRGHRQHESTLQSCKRLKQGTPLVVTELWDEHCMSRICLTSGVPISVNAALMSSALKLRISFKTVQTVRNLVQMVFLQLS